MLSKSIKNCKLLIKKLVLVILYFVIRKVLRYNVVAFENKDNFDGNSGAIFKYLLKNYKKKSLYVWLLKDKSNLSQSYKNTFAYEHTQEAFTKDLLVYCADYLFCDDVIIGKKRKGQRIVYLTHGVPATKNVKGIINVPEYVDYAVSTSVATEAHNRYQFSLSDKTQSIITGLPRTDVFGVSQNEIKKITDRDYKKVIIWLPTFRTSIYEKSRNDSSVALKYDLPLISSEDDYNKINDYLQKKQYSSDYKASSKLYIG